MTSFTRKMIAKFDLPNCFILRSVFVVIITASLLRLTIGAESEEAKRITVNGDEVSEEGAVPYDEKPSYEIVERHNCTFFYDNRYPAFEGGLVNCSWYTNKACCKRTEVTSVFSAMDPLYSTSKLCRQYINFLMCFFCSPDQYKFYKPNTKAMVCLNYCESMYEECKTAGFNKTLIGEAYANGTAFCSAQNFDVTENADCFKFDPTVFDHSCRIGPWALNVLLVVAGFYVSRCQIFL